VRPGVAADLAQKSVAVTILIVALLRTEQAPSVVSGWRPTQAPESKPVEPDPDHAGEGKAMYKTVLILSGLDPSAGAGLLGDVKAVSARGTYAVGVVTALTAQSTSEVTRIEPVDPGLLGAQLDLLAADLPIDAIKSGLVGSERNIEVLAERLRSWRRPYVLDPVAISTSGRRLTNQETARAMERQLFPLATLVTPNADEAAALIGAPVRHRGDAERAARALLTSGCGAVLVKGGHFREEPGTDVLVTADAVHVFPAEVVVQNAVHGAGCALASTIAAELAHGRSLSDAVKISKRCISSAIAASLPLGRGARPVNSLFSIPRENE
jgi:hydroxymethylpyrimidine kinase/phosphomethylpyrimidine kinase